MKQIRIKNFQAQRDLTIDLSPGITTIVGETDCGKSSTLRAIEWALTNKSRKNITTWGQDETVVTVVTGDNEISRIKNKKKNVYSVNGMEFAALRQDVPPEIEKLLNVAPESIQSQFSDIFWFTLTGGELVKKLNRIVNLDIIDFSFSRLNTMQNDIRSTITVYEDRLQAKEEELKKFEKLKILREKLNVTKGIRERIAKTSEELKIKEDSFPRFFIEPIFKKYKTWTCFIFNEVKVHSFWEFPFSAYHPGHKISWMLKFLSELFEYR